MKNIIIIAILFINMAQAQTEPIFAVVWEYVEEGVLNRGNEGFFEDVACFVEHAQLDSVITTASTITLSNRNNITIQPFMQSSVIYNIIDDRFYNTASSTLVDPVECD